MIQAMTWLDPQTFEVTLPATFSGSLCLPIPGGSLTRRNCQENLSSLVQLPKTDIAPENRPSQKEIHLPTIHFQVRKWWYNSHHPKFYCWNPTQLTEKVGSTQQKSRQKYLSKIPNWWLNQPIWKICSSNWIVSRVKIKDIWNHHHHLHKNIKSNQNEM